MPVAFLLQSAFDHFAEFFAAFSFFGKVVFAAVAFVAGERSLRFRTGAERIFRQAIGIRG